MGGRISARVDVETSTSRGDFVGGHRESNYVYNDFQKD